MKRYWIANGVLTPSECGNLVCLDDAQATVEALQRERDHAKKMEAVQKEVADNQTWHVRELRAALDAEREKVAAWKARVVEKEAQANEISGNYQQLSASHDRLTQQLSQLQALVRALPHQTGDITKLNVEVLTIMDAHPFIDLLKYRATLDATTPAPDTSIIGRCEPPSQWGQNAQVRGDIS